MRLLILGEGATDLGRIGVDGSLEMEGALPILVRKLVDRVAPQVPVEIRAQQISKIRLFNKRIGRSGYGYANKLLALLALKEGREVEAVIAVVDRDGERHDDRIAELNRGRNELGNANKPCAVGVAIEMIEAWLLADEKALRIALADTSIQRQPDPETLTTNDEKSDQHPKTRLRRFIEDSPSRENSDDSPDLYAAVARAIDVDVLEHRCPRGFGPFAKQVRELVLP
jgi:Domain of unknown function (DUF4276)